MSWPLNTMNYEELYIKVLGDVTAWFISENRVRPLENQIVDKVQTNALLNFITFDLHTLVTEKGFVHMQELLQAEGTEQTVMIRLKDLVTTIYIKYGEKDVDRLRKRVYKTIDDMYGLTFKSEDIDVNNTFWLYPFFKHVYTVSLPLNM